MHTRRVEIWARLVYYFANINDFKNNSLKSLKMVISMYLIECDFTLYFIFLTFYINFAITGTIIHFKILHPSYIILYFWPSNRFCKFQEMSTFVESSINDYFFTKIITIIYTNAMKIVIKVDDFKNTMFERQLFHCQSTWCTLVCKKDQVM